MTTEPSPGTRPVACPDCGIQVRPAIDRLCPNCGYPLLFMRAERRPAGRTVTRIPGEADDVATGPIPLPVLFDRPTPPGPGGTGCPRCALVNPPSRIRCGRCGLDLRMRPPAAVPAPAPPTNRRRRRTGLVLTGLLAAALVAGTTVFLVTRDDEPSPAGSTSPVSPGLVQVNSTAVTASASSSIPGIAYAPSNTIDGDRTTAWHSDGKRVGSVGVRLTYQFARPVRLARIVIVSGFARSTTDYTNNQRMSRATVRTDAIAKPWSLADTSEPQSLDFDPKPVTTVTFVVEAVYPGTRYSDVTVSEVTFSELT